MAFLSRIELEGMGFAKLGSNVLISDKASIYNCSKITIGHSVRVDDFCLLYAGEGGIDLGNYIHIAAYSSLIGAAKITLSDFCGLSSRTSVYSSSDDYSGIYLTNPMVNSLHTNVESADVNIGRHVILGTGSVVLPGVTIEEGVAVGALSLVYTSCSAFGIYAGIPARRIKERSRELLVREQEFLKSK